MGRENFRFVRAPTWYLALRFYVENQLMLDIGNSVLVTGPELFKARRLSAPLVCDDDVRAFLKRKALLFCEITWSMIRQLGIDHPTAPEPPTKKRKPPLILWVASQ
jgi:hypothetical protein